MAHDELSIDVRKQDGELVVFNRRPVVQRTIQLGFFGWVYAVLELRE